MNARVCPQPVAGRLCCGRVEWTRVGADWHSRCSKCRTTGLAAVGERAELEAEELARGATVR